jgi:hypothetical protein
VSNESAIWKILVLAVGLLTAAVPAWVAYDMYGRGSIPEKQVELFQLTTISPLRDLSVLGQKVDVLLRYQDQTFKNLVITSAWITNKGRSPILPADFYEPFSVTVDEPWKIIAVEDRGLMSPEIRVHWKRASDTRFEAEPLLLNPGDRLDPVVYLTNTNASDMTSFASGAKEPVVRWNTRIANLRAFSKPPDLLSDDFGIMVSLSGWALPFTLVAATLFQALYLHLLLRAGLLRNWGWWQILLVLLTSLLAYAAAESIATYLFPGTLYRFMGVSHWLNAPWIVIHIVVIVVLYSRTRRYLLI